MADTSEDPESPQSKPQNEPQNEQQKPRSLDDHYAVKRTAFLEHLAISSSVKQSAAVAGIPNSTLYLWQRRYPDFAADWLLALAAGYELLEMEMLERARQGTERKVYYQGKVVDTVRDYDNKMALNLLRLHKEAAALVRAAQAEAAAEQAAQAEPVRDTLAERLAKANVRLRAYQAEKRRERQGLNGGGASAGGKHAAEQGGMTDGR